MFQNIYLSTPLHLLLIIGGASCEEELMIEYYLYFRLRAHITQSLLSNVHLVYHEIVSLVLFWAEGGGGFLSSPSQVKGVYFNNSCQFKTTTTYLLFFNFNI